MRNCVFATTIVFAGIPALVGYRVRAADALYVADDFSQSLYTASTTTGSTTLIGNYNFAASDIMADLAYDPLDDILYGTTTGRDNLYSINRVTGVATLIGPLNASLMHGLAFDSATGNLYGASTSDGNLYRIDRATGAATSIGNIGSFPSDIDRVGGLAFDPVTHGLYGCVGGQSSNGQLITINTATGHGTYLESTQPLTDIAFQPGTDVLFGIDNQGGKGGTSLYTIDIKTGQPTLIGPTGLGNALGLEFAPAPEPSAIVLAALGGLALLAWRGRWRCAMRCVRPR